MGKREIIKLARREFEKLEEATFPQHRFCDGELFKAGVPNLVPMFNLPVIFVDEEDYAEYEKASKS